MARRHRLAVFGSALAVSAATSVLTATGASAHVTVNGPGATQGGYSVLTFRVPTESDTLSTTALSVQLPTDHPIASVSVQPHTGWSFTTTKSTLNPPLKTDDGELTQAVTQIDWKADDASSAIKPGEFDQFNISAGPLPEVDSLTFKAIQTYSDGSKVSWIETAAAGSSAEPEHPAPTLRLAKATDATTTADASTTATPSSESSNGAAVTGVVLGGVGIVLAAGALVVATRRRA